jgi:pimeloyl-ACP methyl ester carboxylesterase
LIRTSRDFDELARALSRNYRVVCPDIVGRGESDWLPPGVPYEMEQYICDMNALIARLHVPSVDWLGTSMGGIIGMHLASLPNTPIRRLVLNDIGPHIDGRALRRIGTYVSKTPCFDSLGEVEAYFRGIYSAADRINDQQWHRLAIAGSREERDGTFSLHYDPEIGETMCSRGYEDVDLWSIWKQVHCPQMLMWGEASDILTEKTVIAMGEINPQLQVQSYAGIGHTPSLMVADQIQAVMTWLRETHCH